MVVKRSTKIIYDTDNLHLVTFAKNLLEYFDDYSRSVAKNDLWYLDLADSHERRPAQADYNAGFHVTQALREHPSENHAVLKYESTSTLSDFVQILYRVT